MIGAGWLAFKAWSWLARIGTILGAIALAYGAWHGWLFLHDREVARKERAAFVQEEKRATEVERKRRIDGLEAAQKAAEDRAADASAERDRIAKQLEENARASVPHDLDTCLDAPAVGGLRLIRAPARGRQPGRRAPLPPRRPAG